MMLLYLSLILCLRNVYQADWHRLVTASVRAIISLNETGICDSLCLIIDIQIKIPEAIFATGFTEALIARQQRLAPQICVKFILEAVALVISANWDIDVFLQRSTLCLYANAIIRFTRRCFQQIYFGYTRNCL